MSINRNTQIEHTCVVFRSWHINNTTQFVLSCLAIVALGVFYEYLRALQKTVDARIAASLSKGKHARRSRSSSRASESAEDALLLSGRVLTKPSTGYVHASSLGSDSYFHSVSRFPRFIAH